MPYGRSRLTASAQIGDPFLGGLVRGIGRAVGGFVRGGPLGAISGVLGPILGGAPSPIAVPPIRQLPRPGRAIGAFGGISPVGAFGGIGAVTQARPAAAAMAAGGDGCQKGHRLNKSGYFLQSGTFVAPFSRCVRIRRTNPGNTRALRRSLRRVESFAGLVSRARKATRRIKKI